MNHYKVKCLFCKDYIRFKTDKKDEQYMGLKCNRCNKENIFYFKPYKLQTTFYHLNLCIEDSSPSSTGTVM